MNIIYRKRNSSTVGRLDYKSVTLFIFLVAINVQTSSDTFSYSVVIMSRFDKSECGGWFTLALTCKSLEV